MTIDEKQLKERYKDMETHQLLLLLHQDLLPVAREILMREVASRDVSPDDQVIAIQEIDTLKRGDYIEPLIAPIARRVNAFIADAFIIVILFSLAFYSLLLESTVAGYMAFVFALNGLAYLLFRDFLWNGQSFGKKISGIVVIVTDPIYDSRSPVPIYAPCDFSSSVIRNVTLIMFNGIDLLAPLFTKNMRRVGDMFAGTAVVDVTKLSIIDKKMYKRLV